MAPEPPKRRAPSSPELPRTITGAEQPEQRAVRHHPGLDGAPQPPPKRSPTLTAMPAPPPLPLEHQKTQRAPSTTAQTVRATPAAGIRIPSDETPPSEPPGASAQTERDRAELAEFRRRERVQTESRGPGPYQPPLRSQSPAPSSTPAKVDQALGMTIRHLLAKAAPFLLAAAGIGGGVTAVAKPSADPVKTDAILSRLENIERKQDHLDAKVNGVLDREAPLTEFVECLYEQQADYFEQLLPSQQRLVTGSLQRSWVDRCRNRRPKR